MPSKYTREEVEALAEMFNERNCKKAFTRPLSKGASGDDALRIGFRTIMGWHIFGEEVQKIVEEHIPFLFDVPLKKVPLYINKFPAVAKWRLKCGK